MLTQEVEVGNENLGIGIVTQARFVRETLAMLDQPVQTARSRDLGPRRHAGGGDTGRHQGPAQGDVGGTGRRRPMTAKIVFIELPSTRLAEDKAFYSAVFGMDFTDFGPSYACTMTGEVDLGFQGEPADATSAPLTVIEVADLEATLAAVRSAGAEITRPIFAFPGGRRFHFRDPSGNELAALKPE